MASIGRKSILFIFKICTFKFKEGLITINIGSDEAQLTDNLHRGFIELCNDGQTSLLRIFYLEDGEQRLERECIQISGLERAEDCSNLVFRICRLKSGADCNEHVLMKPERSKDCHAIFYAFRYLQKRTVQQQSAVQKRTLVKKLSTFNQISVTHQAYIASNPIKLKNGDKAVKLRVKNGNQKRKPLTSTDIYLDSPTKKLIHEPEMEAKCILLDSPSNQHSDELLKEDTILEINDNLKSEMTSLDDSLFCIRSVQSAPDLSTSFERLSAGTDAISSKGFLNLGNSCYMNAVLQGLFHVEAFKDLLNVVPESSQGTVLSALKALRKNYQEAAKAKKRCLLEDVFKFLGDERFEMTEQEAAYSILNFQILISRIAKFQKREKRWVSYSYCNKKSMDAQEFLTIVLEKIDSELESPENNRDSKGNYLSESMMSLSSIFGLELKHEITCSKCGAEQIMYEKGVFLPIQIKYDVKTDRPSLQLLLENCLKSEVVEHVCLRCDEKYATMKHEFRSLSKCLIIFLKRYDFKHSKSRRGQRKLKDAVKLSMRIRLVSYNGEQSELKNGFSRLLPISSASSDDKVSCVLETPPDESTSSSSNNSKSVKEDIKQIGQKDLLKTVQGIDDCSDEIFVKEVKESTKSSVTAYDSNAGEKMDYLTLFCLPRPDFCERSCAKLNICCHSSAVRQEPKPLLWKSVPSNVALVEADGNCLFRSIALCLSGTDEEHLTVRKNVVKFEEKYDDQLREINHFSQAEWKEHIKKMTNDGEWATEIELFALAALLDAEIWTFLNGKWLRYRPLYTVGKDGKSYNLPIQKYDGKEKDAIFLINENFHYKPVLDIISNGEIYDYRLAAVISHKGSGPSSGHYVCDVRNQNGNNWMHFDDSYVEEREEADVISECIKDGYIFFYVAGAFFSNPFFSTSKNFQ
uniref:Ubiquitin carboxyl-terminal hydrolase n=1 Tax=Elaeophora elaphi TaxID=1147741 RepID=A0A0R3RUC3_9BILA